MPLIFVRQLINGALFLKANFFSPNALLFAVLVAVALAAVLLGASSTVISPFTTMYASLKSHNLKFLKFHSYTIELLLLLLLLL